MKTFFSAILTFTVFFSGADAVEKTQELFNYPLGTPLNTTTADFANGWSSGWMADVALTAPFDNSVTVVQGLNCPVFASRGLIPTGNGLSRSGGLANEDSDLYRGLASPIDWSTDSVRYLSALVTWEASHPTGASRVRFSLSGEEQTVFGLSGNGVDSNKLRISIRNTYGATVSAAELFDAGKTYMLVAKIQTVATGNDVISVSVFRPDEVLPETEPTWDLSAAAARSDRSDVFGFDGRTYSNSALGFDELRIADTWDEVTSSSSVQEFFSYPAGTQLNTSTSTDGLGWISGWMGDVSLSTPLLDTITVSSEGLFSGVFGSRGLGPTGSGLLRSGNLANEDSDMHRGLGKAIDWSTDSVRYFSSLVYWEKNSASSSSRLQFKLNGEATTFGFSGDGINADKMRLSIRNTLGATVFGTELFDAGRTYMLVAKIQTVATGQDVISITLFDPSEVLPRTEPVWDLTAAAARSDQSDVLGFDGQVFTSSLIGFDELRMGSTWDEVSAEPFVVEPAQESFIYPIGTPLNQTSADPRNGWNSGWKSNQELTAPIGDEVKVVAGTLESAATRSLGMIPDGGRLQVSVNAEYQMWRGLEEPIDWSSDSVSYFRSSISWQNSHASGASRIYFELGDTGTRFGLSGNGVVSNNLFLSVDRSSSSRYARGTTPHPHNQNYILVAKIETVGSGSDRISLALIQPNVLLAGAEPAWQHQVTLERSDITRVLGVGSQLYHPSATLNLDDMRMGSSWEQLNADTDPALALGPVGYWPMDEGSGRVIYDRSGNGNHAEAFSVPWRGGLASFDWDRYQWIQIPHQAAYASPSFSVGMWVYNGLHARTVQSSDASADEGIVLFGQPLRMKGNDICWENLSDRLPGGMRLRMGFPVENGASLLKVSHAPGDDTLGIETSKVTLPTASWQHVFYTYDQSGVGKLYLNGQLAREVSGIAYQSSTMPLVLGSGQWGVNVAPTQSMQGSLRNAALYNRVLTGSEVAGVYEKSRPDAGLVYETPPVFTDSKPWPSMAVEELLAAARDTSRSDHDRAMATMEIAGRGAEARSAVPDLRDLLHQLSVTGTNLIPGVEEIFRNALIHALLSIEPDRPDVAHVLDAAYAKPYVETLDWQNDLAGSLYATHRQNGNWRAALQVAREHNAALSAIPAITGWGSTTMHTQIDGIQSRLPLDERYFNSQFFTSQNPYYDAHYTAYDQVALMPDGSAYATVVERITYQEAYGQWSANLSSYDATVPDPNGLWSRLKLYRLHPDGSRDEQRLVGDWFIFNVSDEKYYGWSIARDKNGYIHLVGGMHNSPSSTQYLPGVWKRMGIGTPYTMYWISKQPDAMDQLEFHGKGSDPRYLPNVRNYMKFTKSSDGTLFAYGRGDNWTFALSRYDTGTGVWTRISGTFAGMMNTAATANPEWFENLGDNIKPYYYASSAFAQAWQPAFYNYCRDWRRSPMGGVTFDRSGRLYAHHFLSAVGEEGKMQEDSMIVYSDDLGSTFHNVMGERLSLPITSNPIPGHDASIERGNSPDYLATWQKLINSYKTRPSRAFNPFHDPELYPQPAAVISEALDLPNSTWSMTGRAAMRYDEFTAAAGNDDCLQLSTVSANSTALSATFTGPGFIDFHYKTATETGRDVFSFSVNGVEQLSASGNGEWQTFRQSIPVGAYTVEWKYLKDAANNDPLDAVFLDQFVWTEDPSRDSDGDGITDIFEDYFGTDPTRHSRGIELLGADNQARTFKFSHPKNANPAIDLVGRYRWSNDLKNWHGSGETQNGSTITFQTRTLENSDVEVTATASGDPLNKLFIILELANP